MVDSPANEAEFLVKKAKDTESNMNDKSTTPASDTESVSVKQTEAHSEQVQKALETVNSIVASVVSLVQKNGEKPAAEAAPAAAATPAAEPAKTEKSAATETPAAPAASAPPAETPAATTKAAETPAPAATPAAETDVEKAARMGVKRTEDLQKALEGLAGLQTLLQGLMPSAAAPASPAATATTKAAEAPAADLTAAIGTEVKKALEGLPEALKESITKSVDTALEPVLKRLKDLEEARPAPSGGGDGSAKTTVQKSTSIWTGLI